MQILTLGGSGFLGSHLVEALLEAGHRVRSMGRTLPGLLSPGLLDHPGLELVQGDLRDRALMAQVLKGCEVAFHLVSSTIPQTSNQNPGADVESNLLGTIGLLEQARSSGLRQLIFLSSGGTVYGIPRQVPIPEGHPLLPQCSYGITKVAIEHYLHLYQLLHGIDYRVLRLANPYGPGQRVNGAQGAVAVFLGKVLREESISLWGDGTAVRDFIYVDDVVSAMQAAMHYQGGERLFNIGSGKGMSLLSLVEVIEEVTGAVAKIQFLPSRPFDLPSNVLCIDRARLELGWAPQTDLHNGIEAFYRTLRPAEDLGLAQRLTPGT